MRFHVAWAHFTNYWWGHDENHVNTWRQRQDGRHFADDVFTCIFFNENCCILITFSLKYVRKGPIDDNRALVQIMAWRRSGDKPLSEPMTISLPTHICVTRLQWVKPIAIWSWFKWSNLQQVFTFHTSSPAVIQWYNLRRDSMIIIMCHLTVAWIFRRVGF